MRMHKIFADFRLSSSEIHNTEFWNEILIAVLFCCSFFALGASARPRKDGEKVSVFTLIREMKLEFCIKVLTDLAAGYPQFLTNRH